MFFAVFGIYVRNIPPKAPKTTPAMAPGDAQRFLEEAMKDGTIQMTSQSNEEGGGVGVDDQGEPRPAQAPDLSDIGATSDETKDTNTQETTTEINNEDHMEL